MFRLHLFNPWHDEALAAHSPYYTPTAAARRLEAAWGQLPLLWAGKGDCVGIFATRKGRPAKSDAVNCLADTGSPLAQLPIVAFNHLGEAFWQDVSCICPWGWDALLVHRLRKAGAPERLLPDATRLEDIRRLSSRQTTARLLPLMRSLPFPTIGHSTIATTEAQVRQAADDLAADAQGGKPGHMMGKSLWSCSGRGVFSTTTALSATSLQRIRKLLQTQGGIEIEPLYQRVADFALEFEADAEGRVRYIGLSLFHTSVRGAYTANYIAPEAYLIDLLNRKVGRDVSHEVAAAAQAAADHLTDLLDHRYSGPLGVDMMYVVPFPLSPYIINPTTMAAQARLHPCVEVNLRRTMGAVALSLRDKLSNNLLKSSQIPLDMAEMWYFCL